MTRGGLLSFLGMAAHEFRAPVVFAAAAFVLGIVMYATAQAAPRAVLALPAAVFLGATLWGWAKAHRRLRALDDIPLSRIGSAAQGYARLEGRAAYFPGHPLVSPGTHRQCCWYHYLVVRPAKHKNDPGAYRHEETSEWSFAMADGSGECVVDPAGAQIIPVRAQSWQAGDFLHAERLILAGDPILVLGEFSTSSDAVLERDLDLRVGELIAEWKKDMPALKRRFDLSGDGEFSEQEWRLVRSGARREVEKQLAAKAPSAQNLVSRPRDDHPFLISAQAGEHLERDLRIWAWIHMLLFLGGVVLLADWLFRR